MKTKITSSSLQELINKKADLKAREFVNTLLKTINSSGILPKNDIDFEVVGIDGYEENFRCCFMKIDSNEPNSPVYKLYEKKLKEFIKIETKDFVNKVNQIVEQSDALLNM